MIFFNEKKIRKIRIIFDIENWLWKSEIRIFQSPPAKRTLICQKKFLWKSAIFHSIKLPFDAEVAEKILNGIYCWMAPLQSFAPFFLFFFGWQHLTIFFVSCFCNCNEEKKEVLKSDTSSEMFFFNRKLQNILLGLEKD